METEQSIPHFPPGHDGSGSDSDDERFLRNTRTSTELADHDRQVLFEEEEREELLTETRSKGNRSFFSRKGGSQARSRDDVGRVTRPRVHKGRKRKADRGIEETGELLYEMEEGGPKEETSSQASSSSIELDKYKSEADHITEKGPMVKRRRRLDHKSRQKKILLHVGIGVAILLLLLLLVFGAYKASQLRKSSVNLEIISNGTSKFAPTTILISLDGFRADFLYRGLTPTLNSFVAEGVSPRYMLPSFPSVTFPNHYTLVTGLHPESHGVVGNSFWDPMLDEDFFYTDPTRSMQPKWWAGGEPLWVTAEKANVTTAVHMWPGSEAHIMSLEPTFLDKFNGTEDLTRKVDRILELLDTPATSSLARPQLIAAYVPVVDADGHLYGPNSTEIRKTIQEVDSMLHNLFTGLDQRNLTKIVNIVIVSDHGMATTSTERLIQLDNLIDLSLIDRIDGWPLYGLRPKNPADLQGLYDKLLGEAENDEHFDVYNKETMPERYHFSNNDRIAPLWVIPQTGWAIVHKEDFDVKEAKAQGKVYHPKGLHGYDHEHPLMRSIFIARGPAFPHEPNSRLEVFQNIEVYNIVCDSLGIEPKPNNGTLRLPLKPIGVHSTSATDDGPGDLPSDGDQKNTASTSNNNQDIDHSTPTAEAETKADSDNVKDSNSYWAFITGKFEEAKAWADDLITKLGGA
ncbi:MAG: hypothetical protein LQ343_001803 [Gyalolechia ehrenbergii]|nr:MAG: hypothetical protein LQ343_001803 [Gyalolechia ehrenbergii]